MQALTGQDIIIILLFINVQRKSNCYNNGGLEGVSTTAQ